MKQHAITILLSIILSFSINGQDSTKTNEPLNAVNTIVYGPDHSKNLTIGAYGQLEFSQQLADTAEHNALIDVHRMVLFMGYMFNDRTHFVTEIEFEHVNEAAVEQAFLNYRITKWMDMRAGLILIPMGIINEYHEPTTFNGTLRPNIDNKIVPSTWRELGMGITGRFDALSLKYQLYAVNGFNGYGTSGMFKGDDGLRGGRQKGIKSYMTAPDVSVKFDYYGFEGLKFGAAGYFGTSESKLYEGLWLEDSLPNAQQRADSSVVGIMMLGFDVRYQFKGFEARAQYIMANLSNTEQYNEFANKDLGSSMAGYYVEAGYNILQSCEKTKKKLVVFVRYENYDTHKSFYIDSLRNDAYNRTDITIGAGFKVAEGAVFKADYQLLSNAKQGAVTRKMFNMGIGIWF